jgi:hypothetical protein
MRKLSDRVRQERSDDLHGYDVTNGRERDLIREEQIARVCVQSNFMELNDDTIYDTSQDGRFYRRY